MSYLFGIVLSLLSIFLILLVLVQRGRGGGLTGALGGMGGSSAFGAKAGDVFTRITIVTAAIWIGVCVAAVIWAKNRGDRLGEGADSLPAGVPPLETTDTGAASEQPAATTVPSSNDAESSGAESSAIESAGMESNRAADSGATESGVAGDEAADNAN